MGGGVGGWGFRVLQDWHIADKTRPPIEREPGQYSRPRAWILHGNINQLHDGGGKSCPGKSWAESSLLLDTVRLHRGIGFTGDAVGRAAKRLASI